MAPVGAPVAGIVEAFAMQAVKVTSTIHESTQDIFCRGAGAVPPTGTAALTMLTALGLMRLHVRSTSEAQAARSLYLMVNVILVLNYTVVILDSYDLCKKIGLSGGASGRMVGMYMLGFCAGAITMWLVVRRSPELWRERPRRVLLTGLSFQLVGACAYAWVSQEAAGARHTDDFGPFLQDVLQIVLMASRFIGGIGSGSCQQFFVPGMLHLTAVPDRSVHTGRWVFSGMLAIGFGPVLAATMQQLEPCGGRTHYELVGHVQIIVALGAMAGVAFLHPDLRDCEDHLASGGKADQEVPDVLFVHGWQLGDLWKQRLVVCGCLCMVALRAFGVSAIEVTIAMILEEKYDWDQRITGLTIGAVFLCSIPLKIFHSNFQDCLPVLGWIRILAFVAVLGSMLLFGSAEKVLPSGFLHITGAERLIAAGIIVFPTFYLSDALGSGLMHQNVLPEGSLFDGNHAQLWYNFMQGMGRFLGPWMARKSVQANGQDSFAAQQMLVTLAFLGIFESLVRPCLKDPTKATRGAPIPSGDEELGDDDTTSGSEWTSDSDF